jgi:hypothetical protein
VAVASALPPLWVDFGCSRCGRAAAAGGRRLPLAVPMNERLLVAVGHPKPAVPLSVIAGPGSSAALASFGSEGEFKLRHYPSLSRTGATRRECERVLSARDPPGRPFPAVAVELMHLAIWFHHGQDCAAVAPQDCWG